MISLAKWHETDPNPRKPFILTLLTKPNSTGRLWSQRLSYLSSHDFLTSPPFSRALNNLFAGDSFIRSHPIRPKIGLRWEKRWCLRGSGISRGRSERALELQSGFPETKAHFPENTLFPFLRTHKSQVFPRTRVDQTHLCFLDEKCFAAETEAQPKRSAL